MATSALGYQSFYQAQLTSAISAADLTIPLDVVPTPSEGFLVIESTSSTKREIIYYTSKTASAVVCPSGGRGYDGTTAQSHTQNSIVIMAPVAAMFSSMRDLFETTPQGWTPVTQTVSSVTYNGNRSYSLTMSADVSATLSPGMRVRTTRTVSAPTQCTSLNGTTQYYSRASASLTGITFTNNFVCSAWVKLTSYPAASSYIISRYNATSGWGLRVDPTGTVSIYGWNAGAANYSGFATYQSMPLNKWVHITAQLDMSTTSYGGTNSYIMFDGIEVPAASNRGGTLPTSLVQAGNLEVGSANASTLLPGKIAQAAVFNAKVTQATMRGYISQGLAGTETSLISAYSFNNSINDLNTTNANNLTANGSAVATNADSPFATNSFGTETGTTDYGIVQNVATTTVVVQVPEGCTIPTTGGVSAIAYSTQKAPYGMPVNADRWVLEMVNRVAQQTSYGAISTWFQATQFKLTAPIGQGIIEYSIVYQANSTVSGVRDVYLNIDSVAPVPGKGDILLSALYSATGTQAKGVVAKSSPINLSSATDYYFWGYLVSATGTETFQLQVGWMRWTPATL